MVMITGDYGLTAESLARRIGMLKEKQASIITGAELDEMNDIQLCERLKKEEIIFARMAPEHKLRLVSIFQEQNEVVAVTGDGVNDAPALRKADVGIVMGIVGTDVAKEAADIIITDDNFGAIPKAIEEGRAVFDNIRKFSTYIFSSNVPEIVPFLLTGLFKVPLALNVQQILAIDLGTDLLPALALSTERPEPDVMRRPPRQKLQRIFDRGLFRRSFFWLGIIEALLCFAGYTAVRQANVFLPALAAIFPFLSSLNQEISQLTAAQLQQLAITVYFSGVVFAQIGNAIACRTEINRSRSLGWFSNRLMWMSIGIEILLVILLVDFKPVADALGHRQLPVIFWPLLSLYALILYSLEWIRKYLFRRSIVSKNIKSQAELSNKPGN
jgi:magnesium-transporting ATPase (P-type)